MHSLFIRLGKMMASGMQKRTQPSHLIGKRGHATVAILTMTIEEFNGVRSVFGLNQELVSTAYAVKELNTSKNYPVVIRRASGQTNVLSSQITRDILEDFRPSYLLVIGTAGGHSGRENIKLGDIVVADYIDYSGYWKLKDGVFHARRNACDHPSLHPLANFAEGLSRSPEEWQHRFASHKDGEPYPKVLTGAVVAGDLLMGDADNAEQQRILTAYDKALAFEMESYGVARAVYESRSTVHYNPQFLIIRGISDLVNEGADENNGTRAKWTPFAVDAAATFALVLVDKLLESELSKGNTQTRGHL
jgi:nucleoside phosphorylase